MILPKKTGAFFLRLTFFYALLVIPWPGVQEAYSAAYQAVGNALFSSFGADGAVHFEPMSDDKEKIDTLITVANQRKRTASAAHHSNRLTGYLPTAEVLALILATPLPWARRWKALLWGMVLANVFVAIRVFIVLLYGFSGDFPCAQYSPGPFWTYVLSKTYNVCTVWVSFTFAAPVFIWVLATFRRSDLQAWAASWGGGDAQSRR